MILYMRWSSYLGVFHMHWKQINNFAVTFFSLSVKEVTNSPKMLMNICQDQFARAYDWELWVGKIVWHMFPVDNPSSLELSEISAQGHFGRLIT